jgi:hypothetical protein
MSRRKNVNLSKAQPRLAKAWAMGQRRRLRQALAVKPYIDGNGNPTDEPFGPDGPSGSSFRGI